MNDFAGWDLAPEAVKKLLQEFRSKRILEIGSGARPTIPIEFVKGAGLEYTTNDVSESELTKADPGYKKLLLDMGCASLPGELTGRYDFIFSRMVNEHVKNGENYYRNIHAMLAPGGITVHWFSTLYALPFLMNWLLPDKLSDVLLSIFASRDRHLQGKFVAHYSWCRGPSPRSIRRFEEIGFKVLRYNGYFGHSYYARRLQFLDKLEKKKMTWLARHPQAWACSYAHIILQHPAV
ncbi:MAG TPA: methyltransferase domain-containing protein [Verrucomicrobiae bacterium]